MKLIAPALLLVALSTSAVGAVDRSPVKGAKQEIGKGPLKKQKKKMTKRDAKQLRKTAETDARRHQIEMQRREYQLMVESQRRGMLQQQQQLPKEHGQR